MAEPEPMTARHSGHPTRAFAQTARLLASKRSAQDVLTASVDAAARYVPGCAYAGATVLSRGDRLDTPAGTHEIVYRSDGLQAELREGPCYDAIGGNSAFRVDDMGGETRWPRYGPRAAELGLASVLGLQLYTGEDTLAALTLYAAAPHAFDDSSEEIAAVFAAYAAVALAWSRTEHKLHEAMHSRQAIGEAAGVLMERDHVSAEESLDVLRRAANETNSKLRDSAKGVTENGEESPHEQGELPVPRRAGASVDGARTREGSPDETRRLAAVRRYRILDTPTEGAFDRICALAARFCRTPIATVTIVDENRIWFKARQGMDATETPRDPGLCASAIQTDSPYVVTDAVADPRALNNPLVRGELGLRFYAAAPIVTHDGYRLGTVNVIDTQPREVSADELATLRELAGVVMDELELRLSSLRTVSYERKRRKRLQHDKTHLVDVVDTLRRSLLPPRLPSVPGVEIAAHYHPASFDEIGGDFYDVFPTGNNRWNLVLGDVCGKGPQAATLTSLARHTLRTAAILNAEPVADLHALNEAMLMEVEGHEPRRFCTVVCAQMQPAEGRVRLRVADGGHPPVLVLRRDGTIDDVKGGGTVVGVLPDPTFPAVDVTVYPGDVVLFYTDGITEARAYDGSAFGSEGLARVLPDYAGRPAGEVIAGLRYLVAGFDPPPGDDVALLALTVPAPD